MSGWLLLAAAVVFDIALGVWFGGWLTRNPR